MNEEVLCSLVEDDLLAADEEEVLQAVVGWISGGADEEGRGETLLGEVRYGLIEAQQLAEVRLSASAVLGAGQRARLCDLVDQVLSGWELGRKEDRRLCSKAFLARKGMDVAWGDFAGGRIQHRLVLDKRDVKCLCAGGGRVYGGLANGGIILLDRQSLEERQRLRCEGEVGGVLCMTACGDLVISGHEDGCLRVWSLARGACDHVLRGHEKAVHCVTSWGRFVVSGSSDMTIKLWESGGAAGPWPCLHTLTVHVDLVWAVIVWHGQVISGSSDKRICVCDIVTQQHEATLDAHTGPVKALAVCGRVLLSAGDDGTIGVWALEGWLLLHRLRVSEHMPDAQFCNCLAASGSSLLCGGQCRDGRSGFVVVLSEETLRPETVLRLDMQVRSFLSLRGEVWATLGFHGNFAVAVWGEAR